MTDAQGDTLSQPSTDTETCWLCEARLPIRLLRPDGGAACSDLRWYCIDAQTCTQRWTDRGASRTANAALP